MNEDLIKYLKENLSISISCSENSGYDYIDRRVFKVELKLGDDVISTSKCSYEI